MAQTKYAFIIKAPGYHHNVHTTHLESPAFHAKFIGVENFKGALAAAEILVATGTQVIELCGGFSTAETKKLRLRFPNCDIGLVTYS